MNIIKNDGKYFLFNAITILKKLSNKNYYLRFNSQSGECYLEDALDFQIPDKIYDIEKEFRSIVLKSFDKNKNNTGVLLEGYKGQGKSMTSKLLCIEAELPVIIIDNKIRKTINFTELKSIKEITVL